MAVAIKTKFLGPTSYKGARIVASTADSGPRRSVTVGYDHILDAQDNHAAAAKKLAEKLEWDGDWHIADGGDVYLFVRVTTWTKRFEVAEGRASE